MKRLLLPLALASAVLAQAQAPTPLSAYRFSNRSLTDDMGGAALSTRDRVDFQIGPSANRDFCVETASGDVVRNSSAGIVDGTFTIAMWVRLTRGSTDYLTFFDNRDGLGFRNGLFGRFNRRTASFEFGYNSGWISAPFTLGSQWYHIAFVQDPSNGGRAIYINGGKLSSSGDAQSTQSITVGQEIVFGNAVIASRNAARWNGYLDNVMVFDDALTATQVSQLAESRVPTSPTAPVVSNVTPTSADLAWTAGTDWTGVRGYEIPVADRDPVFATTPAISLTGLAEATAHAIEVYTVDLAGNPSAQPLRTTITTTAAPDNSAPTVPGAVQITNRTSDGFAITWGASSDNVGVVKYEVFVGADFVPEVTTTPSLTQSGLQPATTYDLQIRALDAAGNASAMRTASVTTLRAPDTQAPTPPTDLAVTAVTGDAATATWTAATDDRGIKAYQYTLGRDTFTYSGNVTSVGLSALDLATTYTLSVRAVDSSDNVSAFAKTTFTTAAGSITAGLTNYYAFRGGGFRDSVGNHNLTQNFDMEPTRDRFSAGDEALWAYGGFLSANGTGADLTESFSISAWFKVANSQTLSGLYYIFDTRNASGNGYFARWNRQQARIEFGSDNGFTAAPITGFDANAWNHLAFVFDRDARERVIYLDGQRISGAGAPFVTSSGGGRPDERIYFLMLTRPDPNFFLRTRIDEIRIHGRALQPADIALLYADRDAVAPTAPTGLYLSQVTPTSVSLGWYPATDDYGVARYVIYRDGGDIGFDLGRLDFNIPRLTENTTYTFGVAARDEQGNFSPIRDTTFTTPQSSGLPELHLPDFTVAPNPVRTGTVTLRGLPAGAEVTLFDARGRRVSAFAKTLDRLDVSDLVAGIYLVRVTVAAEGQATRLLVVQ